MIIIDVNVLQSNIKRLILAICKKKMIFVKNEFHIEFHRFFDQKIKNLDEVRR